MRVLMRRVRRGAMPPVLAFAGGSQARLGPCIASRWRWAARQHRRQRCVCHFRPSGRIPMSCSRNHWGDDGSEDDGLAAEVRGQLWRAALTVNSEGHLYIRVGLFGTKHRSLWNLDSIQAQLLRLPNRALAPRSHSGPHIVTRDLGSCTPLDALDCSSFPHCRGGGSSRPSSWTCGAPEHGGLSRAPGFGRSVPAAVLSITSAS